MLGVDFGDSRTGIAFTETGIYADAVCVIFSRDIENTCKKITEKAKELKAEKIILGYPINMDDTIGERGKRSELVAKRLRKLAEIEVVLWDERLTTNEAYELLKLNKKKDKSKIDAVAATVILQSYIDNTEREML